MNEEDLLKLSDEEQRVVFENLREEQRRHELFQGNRTRYFLPVLMFVFMVLGIYFLLCIIFL